MDIKDISFAIDILSHRYCGDASDIREAFKVAIESLKAWKEALEQEPCEDAISRQAVVDLVVANHTELNGVNVVMYSPFYKDIKQLPSVTPQPKTGHWIPVSERLPKEETDVLVCNVNGDIEISSGSYSTEMKNEFIWYTSSWRFEKVIAWMPLPEPYKAESEE